MGHIYRTERRKDRNKNQPKNGGRKRDNPGYAEIMSIRRTFNHIWLVNIIDSHGRNGIDQSIDSRHQRSRERKLGKKEPEAENEDKVTDDDHKIQLGSHYRCRVHMDYFALASLALILRI